MSKPGTFVGKDISQCLEYPPKCVPEASTIGAGEAGEVPTPKEGDIIGL